MSQIEKMFSEMNLEEKVIENYTIDFYDKKSMKSLKEMYVTCKQLTIDAGGDELDYIVKFIKPHCDLENVKELSFINGIVYDTTIPSFPNLNRLSLMRVNVGLDVDKIEFKHELVESIELHVVETISSCPTISFKDCPELMILRIYDCHPIDLKFANNNLQILSVDYAIHSPQPTINVEKCPLLEYLDLQNCSPTFGYLPKLKSLSLYNYCHNTIDYKLVVDCKLMPALKSFRYYGDDNGFDGDQLATVELKSDNLTYMYVKNCILKRITEEERVANEPMVRSQRIKRQNRRYKPY